LRSKKPRAACPPFHQAHYWRPSSRRCGRWARAEARL
jgi:hypothetical protein